MADWISFAKGFYYCFTVAVYCTEYIKMPTCGTYKVPFRGKFGPYSGEGRRMVPAFSVSSLQKDTIVSPPPNEKKATKRRDAGATTFKR